ncbi:MAG: flavin reductase family protein [Planctomycetota bacterium]
MAQNNNVSSTTPEMNATIAAALGVVPSGVFVLTAEHEDRRAGMLVSWVQRVCASPPMLGVAVAKGKPIMPLLSESRKFALCQLGENDRLLKRKFAQDSEPGDDPFLGFELRKSKLGNVPIMKDALAYFECELSCHMDVEGDHDLFVGLIHAAGRETGRPQVRFDEPADATPAETAPESQTAPESEAPVEPATDPGA